LFTSPKRKGSARHRLARKKSGRLFVLYGGGKKGPHALSRCKGKQREEKKRTGASRKRSGKKRRRLSSIRWFGEEGQVASPIQLKPSEKIEEKRLKSSGPSIETTKGGEKRRRE